MVYNNYHDILNHIQVYHKIEIFIIFVIQKVALIYE